MFGFIKNNLKKIYTTFTTKVHALFSRATVDEDTLKQLEQLLLAADAGVQTTRTIINDLRTRCKNGTINHGEDLKKELEKLLHALLVKPKTEQPSNIYLLVGINGSGKTTFAAKLAKQLKDKGQNVLLVAADTFRAAATEQLAVWAHKIDVPLATGSQGQDPAAVVFQACER